MMKKIKKALKRKPKKTPIEMEEVEKVEEIEEEEQEQKEEQEQEQEEEVVIENVEPIPEPIVEKEEQVIELDARGRPIKPKVHARGRFSQ